MRNADTDRIFRRFDEAPESDSVEGGALAAERRAAPAAWLDVTSCINSVRELLQRETGLVLSGDFAALNRLQVEKNALTAKMRRAMSALEDRKGQLARTDPAFAGVRESIGLLNASIESNLRTISAAKEATAILRNNALKRIEEDATDGLYVRTGEIARQRQISVSGVKIKI